MQVNKLNQLSSACRALSFALSAILTLGAISQTFGFDLPAPALVPPQPQSYELRCQGGGEMKVKSTPMALDPRTYLITIFIRPGHPGSRPKRQS